MWTHVMVCKHKTKLLPILAIFRLQEVLLSIPSISQTGSLHGAQPKSRACSLRFSTLNLWISQLGVWVRGYEAPWRLAASRNLTECQMVQRAFADRVLLPVTAAIHQNNEEKPAMRWSFEMGIRVESDKKLFDFIVRLREGFVIGDRCSSYWRSLYKSLQSSHREMHSTSITREGNKRWKECSFFSQRCWLPDE